MVKQAMIPFLSATPIGTEISVTPDTESLFKV